MVPTAWNVCELGLGPSGRQARPPRCPGGQRSSLVPGDQLGQRHAGRWMVEVDAGNVCQRLLDPEVKWILRRDQRRECHIEIFDLGVGHQVIATWQRRDKQVFFGDPSRCSDRAYAGWRGPSSASPKARAASDLPGKIGNTKHTGTMVRPFMSKQPNRDARDTVQPRCSGSVASAFKKTSRVSISVTSALRSR